MPNNQGRNNGPPHSDDYVVQIHRSSGDSWHSFTTLEDAAAFALEVMLSVVDGKTYPAAIWHEQRKLWKPFGRHGRLHSAPTRDALASLARRQH